MPTVSVYVIAYNEAEKIGAAISSVLWGDEVVLVDSNSTDGTQEIAAALGARVEQVEFKGFGDLRNQAIAKCRGDWIFSLDADERCTPEVRDEVLRLVASPGACDAYLVPRRNFFMGRWIRYSGWYPDFRQPQLFRRGALRYENDPVHERYVLLTDKAPGRLRHAIWQFPFKNLDELTRKTSRYSTLSAAKLAPGRASMPRALASSIWGFVRQLVFRRGLLDGWPGLVIAFASAEQSFYRYAKRVEQDAAWTPPVQAPIRRTAVMGSEPPPTL